MKPRRVVEVEVGIYAGLQVFHCFVAFKIDVNWLPWSVLKIAGQPYSSIVSRSWFAYCSASIVLNTRRARSFRSVRRNKLLMHLPAAALHVANG